MEADAAAVDREARKKAEKEAKAKKAEEKAARQAARVAAQQQKGAEVIGPSVTLLDCEGHTFGNLFIQSHAASWCFSSASSVSSTAKTCLG